MSLDFSFHFSKIFHFVGFILVSCVDFLMINHNSYGIQCKGRVSVLHLSYKTWKQKLFFSRSVIAEKSKRNITPNLWAPYLIL